MQYQIDFSGKLPVSAQIGMAQADENADERWKHLWDGCVLAVARKKEYLTADDVLAEFERLHKQYLTHNLSAIGPAMKRAQEMGILKATNEFKRSERIEKKGNLQRVWMSLQYVPF